MKEFDITIESILGGQSPTEYFSGKDQFLSSLAIDPDLPKDDESTTFKMSGLVRPSALAKFSGTEVTGTPLWIVTNPKDDNAYVYTYDGKVHIVDSTLAMGTALNSGNALTTSTGNGAAYYDNYAYFATNTDISRYGALNGSPSLNQTYWTSTLSKSALANTTYPAINSIKIPNHPMYRNLHENCLYFGDVNANNIGVLHKIETIKTSVEGDTDNGSAASVIDFSYGWWPTCISEDNDGNTVVGLIEDNSIVTKQQPFKIIRWDNSSDAYSTITPDSFSDPFVTAIKNINGTLYVFSGSSKGGTRVSVLYGTVLQEVAYFDDTMPPFAGAVDHIMNRITFGGFSKIGTNHYASVWAVGSKNPSVKEGIHNILKATSAGANGQVTAFKYIQQTSFSKPSVIVGWKDDSACGLDKYSTTYGTSILRSGMYRIGKRFQIKKITIPLISAVGANTTITPKLYFDSGSTTNSPQVINNTNFAGKKLIELYPSGANGNTDVFLELTFSGTSLNTVSLPITMSGETLA